MNAKRLKLVSQVPAAVPNISDKMFDILQGIHYCKLCSIPDGSNTPRKIKETQVIIDKSVWYMFINASEKHENIKLLLNHILELFNNPVYQVMYHTTLKQVVKNNMLLSDAISGGAYWKDLSSSTDTTNISTLNYLRKLFMDDTIDLIMNSAFRSEAIPSYTHSMYTSEMNKVAFGKDT